MNFFKCKILSPENKLMIRHHIRRIKIIGCNRCRNNLSNSLEVIGNILMGLYGQASFGGLSGFKIIMTT